MFEKAKEKIKKKLSSSPTYIKFLRARDKLAKRIHTALLAFFDALSPFLTFLCLKAPNPDKNETS